MTKTRDLPFELKSVSEDGTFEGYASTFNNVDLQGDIIAPGAFAKSIQTTGGKVPILWQHDPEKPIGLGIRMHEDSNGLKVKGQLVLGTQAGAEAHHLLKAGAINGLSIGFSIPRGATEWDSTGTVRTIKEIDLHEFSIVTFPANPQAGVTAVKSDGQATEQQPMSVSQVRGMALYLGCNEAEADAFCERGYQGIIECRIREKLVSEAISILSNSNN